MPGRLFITMHCDTARYKIITHSGAPAASLIFISLRRTKFAVAGLCVMWLGAPLTFVCGQLYCSPL